MTNKPQKNLLIILIGNILVWYDFAVYAYLAHTISILFFPSSNISVGLIKTFGIFAVGFFIRPLGAVIFGHIGDRYGRKTALQTCMFVMAIPTMLIGLLPTFQQAGIFSPLLLLILRLVQGIGAGGGVIGTSTYLFEISTPNKQNFWTSWASVGSLSGVLLGSLVVALMHTFLSTHAMVFWGWRTAFLLGIGPGIFGLLVHLKLNETTSFLKTSTKPGPKIPLWQGIKTAWPQILQVIAINTFVTITVYVLFVWMPIYTHLYLSYSSIDATISSSISMAIMIALIPIFALITDKYTKQRTMALFSILSTTILSFPLFLLLINGNIITLYFVQIIFAIISSSIQGIVLATITGLFPINIRFSCTALGFSISTAIFGGTAPLLCTYIMHTTSYLASPALYLIAAGLIALPAVVTLKTQK